MTESLRAWRTRIAILGGVLLTVLASLLLAQTDLMQRSDAMPARRLPLIDVAATIGASEWSLVQLNTPTPQPTAVVMDDETASEMVAAVASCGRAPQDWQTIIVQPNEDLTVIAARVNAGVRELADANCLYLYQVLPGMTLFVPPDKSPEEAATAVAVACGPPAWWIPVPVTAGSTLASLARENCVSRMRPSGVSRTGRAVVPRVFFSNSGSRGLVMSTTLNATSPVQPFSASRISSRCENGQTGMW